MKIKSLTLVVTALLIALPMSAQAACLRNNDIYTWKAAGNRTLIVEDRSHNRYQVKLLGACTDLNFKEALAFKSFDGSPLSCLERGDEIIAHEGLRFSHSREICSVKSVDPYTPAMEAADHAAMQSHP